MFTREVVTEVVTEVVPAKDQPPHDKLELGHFVNVKRGIGVTIDLISARTENIADIDPAKLRFDGDPTIYFLAGRHGTRDRIDFVRDGKRSEMIEVVRDSDADP